VRPNQISLSSVVWAGLAGVGLVLGSRVDPTGRVVLFAAAAGLVELRLLCNMLDGMVAIEEGLQTRSGVIFNELPDRLADVLVLVSAGYAISGADWGGALGWAAAILAVLTAYVRALGGSVGLPQDFSGPMAKPHRMHLLALGCLVDAGIGAIGWGGQAIALTLMLIALGSAATVGRRTVRLVHALEAV
jgi:phosphatidylglycerophosphate synthase